MSQMNWLDAVCVGSLATQPQCERALIYLGYSVEGSDYAHRHISMDMLGSPAWILLM